MQYLYLPTIRGAIGVKQKDPGRSLQVLEAALPYETGLAAGLLPAYVRGLAYLEARDGEKAGFEFQKIIDHPGVVVNLPIGTLARLQMARAYLIQGKPPQAKTAYEDFLNQMEECRSGYSDFARRKSGICKAMDASYRATLSLVEHQTGWNGETSRPLSQAAILTEKWASPTQPLLKPFISRLRFELSAGFDFERGLNRQVVARAAGQHAHLLLLHAPCVTAASQ